MAMAAPVAAAASLIGSGISAYGQYQGAMSQASNLDANAASAYASIPESIIGASNARLAANEAQYAIDDAKRAADYSVKIGENEYRKALVDADLARASGQLNAANAAREKKLALSAIQARGAASGAGPALDVAGQVGAQGEFNKLYALYAAENTARSIYDQGVASQWNAQNQAYQTMLNRRAMFSQKAGFENQALSYNNAATSAMFTANNYRSAASATRAQAPLAAAGTLIGGAGSALTAYRYAGGDLSRPRATSGGALF